MNSYAFNIRRSSCPPNPPYCNRRISQVEPSRAATTVGKWRVERSCTYDTHAQRHYAHSSRSDSMPLLGLIIKYKGYQPHLPCWAIGCRWRNGDQFCRFWLSNGVRGTTCCLRTASRISGGSDTEPLLNKRSHAAAASLRWSDIACVVNPECFGLMSMNSHLSQLCNS